MTKKSYDNWVLGLIIVLVLVGFGIYKDFANPKKSEESVTQEISGAKVIQFKGEEEKTVLEILAENHDVDITDSELGSFVNSINGIKNSESNFWFYYVNGIAGEVAADQYITKDTDKIEWRYESL